MSDYDRCFYEVQSVGGSVIPCHLLRKGHEDYIRDARIEAHAFTGPPDSDAGLRALAAKLRAEADASEDALKQKIRRAEVKVGDEIWVASEGALIGTLRSVASRIESALNHPAAAVCDVARRASGDCEPYKLGQPGRCKTHEAGKFEVTAGGS